jgi:Flp pilus assembly pilin Flp
MLSNIVLPKPGMTEIQPVPARGHNILRIRKERKMSMLKKFFAEEDGQDLVEYGLVIALVVVGGAAAYTVFSGQITAALAGVATAITNAL